MHVELVRVSTADGLRLDGALSVSPNPLDARRTPCDACLIVHGTGGSFYSSTMFDPLRARLSEMGVAVLAINTRGHDLMSTATTREGSRRQGAAFELVGDCVHDLAAWSALLRSRGYQRIALVGHSLGAVKSIYTQSTAPLEGVDVLIAVSPPRLSYARFSTGKHREQFLADFELARSHVDAGRPDTLIEIRFPLPYLVAAAGYVDKYGPEERYNVLHHLPQVTCPTLVTFGGLEIQSNEAFRGLPDEIEALDPPRFRVDVIAGADHFYSSTRDELASRIERWLRSQAERAAGTAPA